MIISAAYSFAFWLENGFLQLNITACTNNRVYGNFAVCYFMSPITTERLYKSSSFKQILCTYLSQVELEILQPSSEAATRGVP